MSNWSEGYISDINYIYGYYEELNPARLAIPFLVQGLPPPRVATACELGFGQGISVNIHAAAGAASWYATDFNPSHTVFADHLAALTGSKDGKLHLSDQGFNEFCVRDDLPDFDYIGLHGIWSWISDDNRRIIVDFLHRKLKPGGVLYVSYNTLPGWSAHAPMRHLLAEYSKVMGSSAHSRQENIIQAIRFGEEVFKNSPQLMRRTPEIAEHLQSLAEKDSSYLVHEYLNQHWYPMYFAQMEEWLSPAKLSFACSARLAENFPPCRFNPDQAAFLESIANPSFAETLKDYLTNQQFRCDYWVKGKRRLNPLEIEREWHKIRVVLLIDRDSYSPNIGGTEIIPEMTDAPLDALADGKIRTVAELQKQLADVMDKERLFLALGLLYAKGDIAVCADDAEIAARRDACLRFNHHVLDQTVADHSTLSYLASPLSGGGFAVGFVEKLFLLARRNGEAREKWADYAWAELSAQGRKMIKDGKPLESDADNLAEIRKQCDEFAKTRLRMIEQLQCFA